MRALLHAGPRGHVPAGTEKRFLINGTPFLVVPSAGMKTWASIFLAPTVSVMGTELKATRFGARQEKEQPMGFEQSAPRATSS